MLSITLPYWNTQKSLYHFSDTLWPLNVVSSVVLPCMFLHVHLPDHQRPAPGKCGWRWPVACGCSRSLCCGKRSSLWGLDWTCQSSLCSPAEESTVNKLNVLVMSHMPFSSSVHKAVCDIYNCGCVSAWVCPHFDMPMTNPSVVGWWSMPCTAHHHIRKHLTRRTAGTKLIWWTNCCTESTMNNTYHLCIDLCGKTLTMMQWCESTYSRACDNVYRSFWVHIRLLFASIAHLKRKKEKVWSLMQNDSDICKYVMN